MWTLSLAEADTTTQISMTLETPQDYPVHVMLVSGALIRYCVSLIVRIIVTKRCSWIMMDGALLMGLQVAVPAGAIVAIPHIPTE